MAIHSEVLAQAIRFATIMHAPQQPTGGSVQ